MSLNVINVSAKPVLLVFTFPKPCKNKTNTKTILAKCTFNFAPLYTNIYETFFQNLMKWNKEKCVLSPQDHSTGHLKAATADSCIIIVSLSGSGGVKHGWIRILNSPLRSGLNYILLGFYVKT